MKKLLLMWSLAAHLMLGAEELIGLPAVLFPYRETVLSSQIDAPALPYHYRIGQKFPDGAELLQLEPRRHQIELNRAQAQFNFAQAVCCDQEKLHQKNLNSAFELKKAQFEKQLAHSQLQVARFNLDCCSIKAPFAGKIVEFFTREYENVRPGQMLCRIIDDRYLLAVIHLPLRARHIVKPDSVIILRIAGVPQLARGAVHEIAPQADHRSGTLKLRVKIDNAQEIFTPGMSGEVCDVQ